MTGITPFRRSRAGGTAGAFSAELSSNLALAVKPPLPVITSPTSADGLVNAAFAYTIQAANVATSFGATGLPGGLTLDPAKGTITGTPTNSGIYAVTIGATNITGQTTGPLTIVIYGGATPAPVITSALTAFGMVGVRFGYAINATNNPTIFFAVGLPAGLAFDKPTAGLRARPLPREPTPSLSEPPTEGEPVPPTWC